MISTGIPFAFQPFQLITLLDMTKIEPNFFLSVMKDLRKLETIFLEKSETEKDAIVSDDDCENVRVIMHLTENLCNFLGLNSFKSHEQVQLIARIQYRLSGKSRDSFGKSYLGFYIEINKLRESIDFFLNEKVFLYLPPNHAEYYDQADLFGIADKFPQANEEITSAGNCYATGNYTASVFHSMRAVEYGLRYIAGKLKVPFPKTYENKQWGELIGAIEGEIKKIIQKPKSAQRDKDLLFYSIAATQFAFIKDAWRNHVMHTRSSYDELQAMSVMLHVKELMRHIAKRK
ncbi:MAG: hypothetical protein WA584_06030 [Pyrinomonadaceae bacterium]